MGCSLLILQIEIIIHLMKYNKHPSTRPILCGISNIRWVLVGVIVGVLVGVSWLGRWAGGGPAALEPAKLRRPNTFRPCRFSTTILHGPGRFSTHSWTSILLLDARAPPRAAKLTRIIRALLFVPWAKTTPPRHPCCTDPAPDTP